MFVLETGYLHRTSSSLHPLHVQEYPQKGLAVLNWQPGDGHKYGFMFVQLDALAERCLDMEPGYVYVTMIDDSSGLDASGGLKTDDCKTWSAILPTMSSFSDSLLRKRFGCQGRRLHALSAVLHLALPGADKAKGLEKHQRLITDGNTKTIH